MPEIELEPSRLFVIEFGQKWDKERETVFMLAETPEIIVCAKIDGFKYAGVGVFRKGIFEKVNTDGEVAFFRRVFCSQSFQIPQIAHASLNFDSIEDVCRYAFRNEISIACEDVDDGGFILGRIVSVSEIGMKMNTVSSEGEIWQTDCEINFQDIDVVNIFGPYETAIGDYVFGGSKS